MKTDKKILKNFITRYNLNGTIDSVKWTFNNKSIRTNFISDDKSLLGSVELSDFDFDDDEIGVYNTHQLIKMLGALEDDIDISINKKANKPTSLQLNDGVSMANYSLSDLSTIPAVPELKKPPKWDVQLKLDKEFISRLLKAEGAIKTEVVTFLSEKKDDVFKIIFGYNINNIDRITINTGFKTSTQIDPIAFSSDCLKNILLSNKEALDAELMFSTEGLAYLRFRWDNYLSEYYLVQVVL